MATTPVQKNIIKELVFLSKLMIAYKTRVRNVVEQYGNEGVANLLDADVQALPGLEGVTAQELQAAKSAHDTMATAAGEFVAGTPMTKFTKVVDTTNVNIIIAPQ
jgi:hypothetical protein